MLDTGAGRGYNQGVSERVTVLSSFVPIYLSTQVVYMENKFVYLLLTVVLLGSIVVFRAGLVPRNFDSLEDAFELYNKCEVSLAVEGEKSVMALGVKDGVTIRDFFYKKNDGYSSSFGFDSDTVFHDAVDGFSCAILHVKKTDEYYIRVYSFVGDLSQISDSCGSVFYSLQPFPSDNTKVKTYHAYIKDFNDSYQLKINDKLMFDIGNKAMS